MAKMSGDKARDSGPGIVLKNSENKDESFVPSTGLTQAQAAQLFAKYGPNALPEKSTPKVLMNFFVVCCNVMFK